METRYMQDLEVGEKFSTGKKIVSQTDVEIYCTLSGDNHPLFLNDEFATKVGLNFKKRIVPGILTFAYAVGLMIQTGRFHDVVAHVSTEKLRFKAPVYIGDIIQAHVEILDKKEAKEDKVLVTYKWNVTNQNGEIVAEGINTCMFRKNHQPW